MLKKTALCVVVALAVTIVAVAIWSFGRVEAVPSSLREGCKPEPPEGYSGPATIWISCEKGNQFGWTDYPYGGMHAGKMSDVFPEPAMFAHCRPNEDFTYDVFSTKSEVAESSRRPEISFVLTDAGLVRDAFINRSSGSRSLDLKVLAVIVSRKYGPTGCGSCRIFDAPPVNLKKEIP
jgi:hypothetical protein